MANTTPTLHIKPAARKLPIKRKTSPHSQPSVSDPDPTPNPNPNPIAQQDPLVPKPEPYNVSAIVPHENGHDDEYYDDDDEEAEEEEDSAGAGAGSGGDLKPPPFKFHRVWSEPDEIRLLQGLLGCWSQGMVFPRDLNLFYDRFCESMPQPYTRSQLSEKLRRLRRKFRTMSGRIANGRDPSRLAPHDRDLLHLCTRLWHPSYAASSPFSVADAAAAAAVSNKRRRSNPSARARAIPSSSPPPPPAFPALLPAPPATPPPPVDKISPDEKPFVDSNRGIDDEKKPLPASSAGSGKGTTGNLLAETVLDVFDGSLKKLRMDMANHGMLQLDNVSRSGTSVSDFSKRWQELRVAELDVLACRLRLVIEDSMRG